LPQIQKNFDTLYIHRLQYLVKVQVLKKTKQSETVVTQTHKPTLNKNSTLIAQQYREKLANQNSNISLTANDNAVPPIEWLAAASNNKDEWVKKAKNILEQQQMKECTFQPNLNQNNHRGRSNSKNNR
jgi:hypothetical protein